MQSEQVWKSFNDPLRRFIINRVTDAYSADDILQEVFIKIHLHIGELKSQEKIQSWIYQIARKAIVDHYRKRKVLESLPESLTEPEEKWHSEVEEVRTELALCLKGIVEYLPEDYRQAILLTEFNGLSQKEMGEQLGLSYSGAKSRVQRARTKLRNMLLECCHFEFDRLGSVISYVPRCSECSNCSNHCSC